MAMVAGKVIVATAIGKRVASIDVKLTLTDTTGTFWVTDLLLQGGKLPTMWVSHPSEIRWSFDS